MTSSPLHPRLVAEHVAAGLAVRNQYLPQTKRNPIPLFVSSAVHSIMSSAEIEMDDLSKRKAPPSRNPSSERQEDTPQDDGVIASWAWVSAGM